MPPTVTSLLLQLASLAGFAALVAFIVNAGKQLGWIQDNQAATWVTGLNLVGLIALFYLKVFQPQLDVLTVDSYAGQIAQFGLLVLGFVVQLLASRATHAAVRGTAVIGTSHGLQIEQTIEQANQQQAAAFLAAPSAPPTPAAK